MNWCLFFVVFFASFLFPALILLFGSMHLFSLFLRRVTTPAIALLLSLRLLLRFLKLCLTPISSNISNLTFFFQITTMASVSSNISNLTFFFQIITLASVRQDLQGIFFPILLMLGHPLLGTSENYSSLLLISLKAFDRVWHKALLAKFNLRLYSFLL